MTAAKRHGTRVSYDLNYRPSLWQSRGGIEAAQRINAELVRHVDVLFGNEEDFHQALGVSSDRHDPTYSQLPVQEYQAVLEDVGARFPNLEVVAATLRVVHSASVNDWGGMAWSASEGHVVAQARPDLLVFDRVGGGDSFAAGLIYGILEGLSLGDSVEYGAAHGALAMTTPGDTSMATLKEVQAMVKGVLPRVQR